MAAIDYGTGPNTTTGDTIPVALAKLKARLLAAGFDPGIGDAATIAVAVRRIETALDVAEAAYVPPLPGTPTPTPTPAPVFTVQPSISPASGATGATFTATDGSASNTTGYTRRWLLNGTSIGTGSTVVPVTAGALSLEVTATGPGGSTIATSAAVTVSSGTPTPGPTLNALSVSPSTGTVGTAYSGTISGRTAGSSLALAGTGAAGLSLSGTTISGTPTTVGAVNVTETLAGATNSPRTSSGVLSVATAPVAGAAYWLAGDQLSWPTDISAATTSADAYSLGAKTMKAHPWSTQSPRFCFHNYRRTGATTAEVVLANNYTIEAAYIELPDGTRRQLFFDDGASTTFTGNTGKFAWTKEDLSISLPANADYRIIWAESVPVGGARAVKGAPVVPASQYASAQGGDVYVTGSTSFASTAASGTLPTSQAPGAFFGHAPTLAVLYGAKDSRDVVLGVGDSIWRYHHNYSGYGARANAGNFGYGYALALAANGRIPYATLAVSSTRPTNLSASQFAARKAMLAAVNYPFTKILCNMGRNNLNASSQSEFDAMWSFLKTLTNDTAKPIIQTTITPVSTINTTSGGTTLAGQTAESNATRDSMNSYIKSIPSGIAGFIDVNAAVEAAGAVGKWPSPGFSTTLAAAASVGDTTISLTAAPQPGDFLSIGVGSSTNEDVFVTTVSGSGPYTVGIQNAGQYTGGIKTARASGVAVAGQGTIDGTHPSTQVYIDTMTPPVVAAKANGVLTGTTTPVVPAPAFTTQPSVSPSSGQTGSTFTATPGTVSNGTVSSRNWLLNGSSISTGTTAVPQSAGTLTYQEFATGSGGNASSAVQSATVTAAPTPTPTPTPTPVIPTANRQIHYDYSDMSQVYQDSARTTLVTADGQPVQSVTDQANGANTTGTGTYRANAANGRGGILFNGTSDNQLSTAAIVNTTFSGTDIPYTIHYVEKVTQLPAATAAPWSIVSTGFQRWSASTSNNYSFGKRNNAASAVSVITDTANNPAVGDVNVWSVRHNGTTADIFKNGTLVKSGAVSTGATTTSRLTMGSSTVTGNTTFERYWAGIMFEWVAYNVAQTDADITSIHTALKSKYGIA